VGQAETNLRRSFLLRLTVILSISLAAFGALFIALYRSQLEQQRQQALLEVSRLLQSSLENAMLKADLDGLRGIVDRLGAQPGMRGAMILNAERQVRFSSDPARLGTVLAPTELGLCKECTQTPIREMAPTSLMLPASDGDRLRSVNPVPNQAPCGRCHGSTESRPINGMLIVDYDATPLRRSALHTAVLFLGAGLAVMLLTLGSGWWFIQRRVLRPIQGLDTASRRLSTGDLDARVAIHGTDELARLGNAFNEMATSLQGSVRALEARRTFLQSLIDAIPDGIRVIDRDYNIVLANAAFERMHGLGRGEAVGQKCYAASHRRAEPCPASLQTCPIHEMRNRPEAIRTVARHARDAGSSPLDVEVFAAPLALPEAEDGGVWVIEAIRDLEQDIRYSQEQRLSELGRLATGVAHEIHNPLAAIRIALQAARRAVGSAQYNPAEVSQYLTLVDSEIDRCVDVTERLLKLAMPARKPQLVDVNRAVHETLALLKWEAQERHVGMVEELASDHPQLMAADGDIRMLVLNLAQNALHAMPQGGRLRVSAWCQNGEVNIRVEDTGVGVPLESRRRIFEPFFSRRADGQRGTGLGLSICRGIVEAAGGKIALTSEVGVGTCFIVTLPEAAEVVTRS
jgi:PAS domain S-box-containing protein